MSTKDNLPPWIDTGGVTSHPGSKAMTLREKIARSIGLAAGHDRWDALPKTPADFIDGETLCCKDDYLQCADAVLALLSDPANISDEMVTTLEARDTNLRRALVAEKALRDIEPFLDAVVCFASTMQEHEPNRIAVTVRHILKEADK